MPVLNVLHQEQQITHFKFLAADRTCLLRLHNLEVRGDRDDRYTTLKAERTGQTASGIELEQTGNFHDKM